MDALRNTILHGDCIELMQQLPEGSIDLAFADPPFNIGYDYDVYDDRRERNDYLTWSKKWIAAVYRALRTSGTFWLAIGDEYAAELKIASQELGFHTRSWVIWYYTFGVNCKRKFTRSHAHLFYFVKDARNFVFRENELENRIPSARQLVYNDKRANSQGRLPDDTWILRPQDLSDCFTAEEDTWYFPRVAGTFKERAGFHGCQMPEQLLGRIIRCCSEPGATVLDPFSGSATTVAVAKKLGRNYVAFDLSEQYVELGLKRLAGIRPGDPLDGSKEPTISAPQTPIKSKQRNNMHTSHVETTESSVLSSSYDFESLVEAFRRSNQGFSLDRVVADPELNSTLADACVRLGVSGDIFTWNHTLFNLRKRGFLKEIPTTKVTSFDWTGCNDEIMAASEIALSKFDFTLDAILCNPSIAEQFDRYAGEIFPNRKSVEYRWAALKLRKLTKTMYSRGANLGKRRLPLVNLLDSLEDKKIIPSIPGVYLIMNSSQALYAGRANNLQFHLGTTLLKRKRYWEKNYGSISASILPLNSLGVDLLGYKGRLISLKNPKLNISQSQQLSLT